MQIEKNIGKVFLLGLEFHLPIGALQKWLSRSVWGQAGHEKHAWLVVTRQNKTTMDDKVNIAVLLFFFQVDRFLLSSFLVWFRFVNARLLFYAFMSRDRMLLHVPHCCVIVNQCNLTKDYTKDVTSCEMGEVMA